MSALTAPRCCRIVTVGRPLELDALLTAVPGDGPHRRSGQPYIDCVLGLTHQMGRVAGVYPAFPMPRP